MIRNELYLSTLTMVLKKTDSTEGVSRGVLVLRDGKMHGGGPYFYTIGGYTRSGSKWKVKQQPKSIRLLSLRDFGRERSSPSDFPERIAMRALKSKPQRSFARQSMRYHGIFRLLKASDD